MTGLTEPVSGASCMRRFLWITIMTEISQYLPNVPLFDKPIFEAHLRHLGSNKVIQISENFIRSSRHERGSLEKYYDGEDYTRLAKSVHRLSGSAKAFGLLRLGNMCDLLESAIYQNESDTIRIYKRKFFMVFDQSFSLFSDELVNRR